MPFQIIRNDITRVEADAIVNTANPEPEVGGGTDWAIHTAAGPELLAAREKIGAIAVGCSAATPAFALHAKYVLHTVSPQYGYETFRAGAVILADTKLPNFKKLTLADLADSLPRIDYLFPNEDEGAWCTGQTDPEAMADVFLSHGVKNVVIKLGARGCFFKNESERYRLDAYRIDPADATGAGDNFLAGFAAALRDGQDHPSALRLANACGAICTTALGASAALRDRAQAEAFIRAHPDPLRLP